MYLLKKKRIKISFTYSITLHDIQYKIINDQSLPPKYNASIEIRKSKRDPSETLVLLNKLVTIKV